MSSSLIVKNIVSDWGSFSFNLEFPFYLTFLSGDSGTGKTLVTNFLKDYFVNETRYKGVVIDYTYLNRVSDIRYLFTNSKNAFFVVDNADILLDEELRDIIFFNDNENQYLVIGRDPEGLNIIPGIAKQLKYENNIFSFIPLL